MDLVLFIVMCLENGLCFLAFGNTCNYPWMLDTVYRTADSEVNQNQV